MITPDELIVGHIYKHDSNKILARLLYVEDETITVEQFGERVTRDKESFLRTYNPINIPPLED